MMIDPKTPQEVALFHQIVKKSKLGINTKEFYIKKVNSSKLPASIKSSLNKDLWWELRREIIKDSNDISLNSFRSPEQNPTTINYLKTKLDEEFVYERSLKSSKIEINYNKQFETSKSWLSETLLFNSGMSSISNSITVLLNSLSKKSSKVKVLSMPGYFETLELFKMHQLTIDLKVCRNSDEFYKELRKDDYDIVFIEPVNFSIWMDSINIDEFLISVINGITSRKLRFFIFDNTLINNVNFPIKHIQEIFSNIPDTVIYTIQSLIKLNQVGLEVSNGGVLEISCNIRYLDNVNYNNLIEATRRTRDIYGQTPSSNQLVALSNEFIYDVSITKSYTDLVFDNNEQVAKRLHEKTNSLRIAHPVLNNHSSLSLAPFIILQIPNASIQQYLSFINLIKKISDDYSLSFNYGTSFGFQNTRYDVIEYDRHSGTSFMRLSVGAFEKNTKEIVDIISEASRRINK